MASRIKVTVKATGFEALSPFVYSDETAEERAMAWTTKTKTCIPVKIESYPKIAIYDPKYDHVENLEILKDIVPSVDAAWENYK